MVPNWVFDTASRTWVAADKDSFSCNKASGYYLSPKYYFDKRIGWYEIIPAASATALPAYMITVPDVVHTVLGDLVVGSKDYQVAKAMGLLDGGGAGGILSPAGANISGTGAGSNNQAATTNGNQSWFDLTSLVNVVNSLQSNANTGNVSADSNTTAGNASTGAASVVANLINLLASAWSWSNGNLSFFMQNIIAPLTGDINLNPGQTATGGGGQLGTVGINGTGANSTNTATINDPNSLNVNAQSTGNIVNNVNVNAASGNADASKNTVVGNVATGNAMAQVNIINLINSFITSGSSFFGILNIFGSLNGDILFPTGFLNGLVPASSAPAAGTTVGVGSTGAGSNNQVGVNNSTATTANNTVTNNVDNNIATTAGSGSANLDANTSVGTVATGAATTNQSLFNMANSSIFGDNAVLVMVNVLGHWVGKIMSLPGTGTSQSALLTGNASVGANGPGAAVDITNTGANSNNQANLNNASKANVNQSSTGSITNNVNVNAQSGNADVSKNTKVGDVSTGKAQADSSVANIFNTVLNVKHWFGVLVINVFGDWVGDVNNDTAAGGYSTAAGKGAAANAPAPAPSSASTSLPAVGLLALVNPAGGSGSSNTIAQSNTTAQVTPAGGKVLTAAVQSNAADVAATSKAKNVSFLLIFSALVMLVAGALAAIDKKLKGR